MVLRLLINKSTVINILASKLGMSVQKISFEPGVSLSPSLIIIVSRFLQEIKTKQQLHFYFQYLLLKRLNLHILTRYIVKKMIITIKLLLL